MTAVTTTSTRIVVVAAASRHGSTRQMAERIAAELSATLAPAWRVVRAELTDLRALDGADAVVLGSAVYRGHWMHQAARALEHLRDAPPKDLWLFSAGPISEEESENEQIISADALARSGDADEHMVFAGRLITSQLSLVERLVVKAVHALSGDDRHWADVDLWARHIAAELGAGVAPGTGQRS